MGYRTASEWRELSLHSLARRRAEQGQPEWEHAVEVLVDAYREVDAAEGPEWDRRLAICVAVAEHVTRCRECHERSESGWTPAERLLTRVEVAPFAAPILAELIGWDKPRGAIRQLVRAAREQDRKGSKAG